MHFSESGRAARVHDKLTRASFALEQEGGPIMNCDLCNHDRTPVVRVDEFVLCTKCAMLSDLAALLQEKREARDADAAQGLGSST